MLTSACQRVNSDGDNMLIVFKDNGHRNDFFSPPNVHSESQMIKGLIADGISVIVAVL